ncbi:hypothetical protein, partial [Enterobacter hormaechei]|uniref:hypothetical protein n=1 Tax=Enterobacter hormaechei TaxID=158836 RepID=UPI0013D747A1
YEAGAVAFTVAGLDADAQAVASFTDGSHSATAAVAADGRFTVDLSAFKGTVTSALAISDLAGNTANVTGNAVTVDTLAYQ